MKVVYQSNDGRVFDTEKECMDHEKYAVVGKLTKFVRENITQEYCEDAGFEIIDYVDVANLINNKFSEIESIVKGKFES